MIPIVPVAVRAGLLFGASLYGVAYLVVIAGRIAYPYELEWMEGATVDHVQRVLEGQPLYVPPSVDFIPFIYSPGYYYVSALAAWLLGLGFVPLRLVSAGASLASAVLVFSLVRRETGRIDAGWLAAALFLATFRLSGYWYDLARPDSLCLLFAIAAVWLIRFDGRARGVTAAGLLLGAAVLTKQTAFPVAAVVIAAYAWTASAHRLRLLTAFAVPLAATVLALDTSSDGWFLYYVVTLPAGHPWTPAQLTEFWRYDLVSVLPFATALSIYGAYRLARQAPGRAVVPVAFACALVGTSWLGRLHEGGYLNTLMPAHAAVAVFFGLGYAGVLEQARTRATSVAAAMPLGLYAVCLLQFWGLVYNPARLIPDVADREAGRRLLDRIASIDGEVYMPFHGHLPVLAGKQSYAHDMAIRDVFKGTDGDVKAALATEIDRTLREHRFAAIVLDAPSVFAGIDASYDRVGPVFDADDVFWPMTGKRTRPEILYVPRGERGR